uniref:MFS domain-containing protein n=1 Tax=Soboliphyme baturini TaxID=241478 RepID=A0A183J801_9BILA
LPFLIGSLLLVPVSLWIKNWKTIQLLIAVFQTLSTLLYYLIPESPRWLIASNRMREAEIIIRRACNVNRTTLPPNLELIKHPEQQQWIKSGKKPNLFQILKSSEILTRTVVISVLWVATLLNCYAVLVCLADALNSERTVVDIDFFLRNTILGALELPSLILCLLISRYTVMNFFLALLAKTLAMTSLYTLCLFTVELFPTVIRNSAVGICSMVACIGVGIASYMRILSMVHFARYPSMVFGLFSLLSAFLVLLMPETRDATLPDSCLDAVVL